MKSCIGAIVAGLVVTVSASELFAQFPDPSARSGGFAGAFLTRARGYEATFWNPAVLGLPDAPPWSAGLPGVSGFLANNSLSYGQIQGLYGEFLDESEKSALLADIRRDDPNRRFEIAADLEAHGVGASIGRFAVAVGTAGRARGRLSADAIELLLFGNVGEDGTGGSFDLEGSDGSAWWTTGVSVSYGHPFTVPALDWLGMRFAVGVTFNYAYAHGLVQYRDRGSLITSDPLAATVDGQRISTTDFSAGSGWSFDLGGVATWGPWTAGLSIRNLIGDLAWNEDEIEVANFTAAADFDATTSDDTTRTFEQLSPEEQDRIREILGEADFPTRVRIGATYQLAPSLSLSGDYEEVVDGMLHTGWDRTLAVGAEFRPFSVLPLRGGLGTSFEDFAFGGGFGIHGGPVHFDLSAVRRGLQDGGDGLRLAASISIWPP